MNKLNFCTLFDINYLTRGIALYESLTKWSNNFHLYIFSFDKQSFNILQMLNLNNVTIIPLEEFEDEELLKIKSTRSSVEYCWTCTPSIILYCLKKFNLDFCTYIDADTYYFGPPEILFEEFKNDISAIITEHRYTKKYDYSKTSGKYCVQFVTIRNNQNGLKILNDWRMQCINWCYARYEDGKLGDQKYLDDWKEKYEGVHELIHHGGGIAPWNMQRYKILKYNNETWAINLETNEKFQVVFFHFHGLKFYINEIISLNNEYETPKTLKQYIYKPYIIHLLNINSKLENFNIKSYGLINEFKFPNSILNNFKNLIRRKKYKNYVIYTLNDFKGIWRYFNWHL